MFYLPVFPVYGIKRKQSYPFLTLNSLLILWNVKLNRISRCVHARIPATDGESVAIASVTTSANGRYRAVFSRRMPKRPMTGRLSTLSGLLWKRRFKTFSNLFHNPLFRRTRESRETGLSFYVWIPAYAGMTVSEQVHCNFFRLSNYFPKIAVARFMFSMTATLNGHRDSHEAHSAHSDA